MTEEEILQRYSTSGLRRNVFTRAGKKAHLQRLDAGWQGEPGTLNYDPM